MQRHTQASSLSERLVDVAADDSAPTSNSMAKLRTMRVNKRPKAGVKAWLGAGGELDGSVWRVTSRSASIPEVSLQTNEY